MLLSTLLLVAIGEALWIAELRGARRDTSPLAIAGSVAQGREQDRVDAYVDEARVDGSRVSVAPVVEPAGAALEAHPIPATDLPGILGSLDVALNAFPCDGTDDCFEQKFAGLSKEQIQIVHFIRRTRFSVERDRIAQERLENGLYRTEYKGPGESVEISRSRESGPKSFGFAVESFNDGSRAVKIADIPNEEYPDFHLLGLEQSWLHQRLHALDACRCSQH